jgi:hypothetical protein
MGPSSYTSAFDVERRAAAEPAGAREPLSASLLKPIQLMNGLQAMHRPRLKRTIEPVEIPDGDVVLMRTGGEDVRVVDPDSDEKAMLLALDGSKSIGDLGARFGAQQVGDAIARMQELDLIEDASDDDLVLTAELARFDRQLRYFSDVGGDGRPTPSECQERDQERAVAR